MEEAKGHSSETDTGPSVHNYFGLLIKALHWQAVYFDNAWQSMPKPRQLATYLFRVLVTSIILGSIFCYSLVIYVTHYVYPEIQFAPVCISLAICSMKSFYLFIYLKAALYQTHYSSFLQKLVKAHREYDTADCDAVDRADNSRRVDKIELFLSILWPLANAVFVSVFTEYGFIKSTLIRVEHALHNHYGLFRSTCHVDEFITFNRIVPIFAFMAGNPIGIQYDGILRKMSNLLTDILRKMETEHRSRCGTPGHSISWYHQRHLALSQLVTEADDLYSTYYFVSLIKEVLVIVLFTRLFTQNLEISDKLICTHIALLSIMQLVRRILIAENLNKKIYSSLNGVKDLKTGYRLSHVEQINQLLFVQYFIRINARPVGLTVWKCFIVRKELIYTIFATIFTYISTLNDMDGE